MEADALGCLERRMARVPIQVFIGPWISALLFIFIFGYVLGGTLRTIGGHPYIQFVMPGVLMMNIITAAVALPALVRGPAPSATHEFADRIHFVCQKAAAKRGFKMERRLRNG